MEEAVLSADEAPANTQTLGPDQTPEGCQPENSLQFQAPRNVEGKFLKGQSGNPAGKPPGIRNRATMIVEQLFDGACGEVSREALAKAMNGDSAVLGSSLPASLDRAGTARRISRYPHSRMPPMSRRRSRPSSPPLPKARSPPPRPAKCRRSSSVIRAPSPAKRSKRACSGWRVPVASLNSPALRRRLDALTDAVRERIERRQRMREYAAAAATLRAALTAAGIDPVQNSGLREFGYAERVVAEWPDTPELQRSDAAFIAQDPKLAGRQSLAVKVAERVGRFAGQPPLDRWTSMSPFDWYAWSLAARLGEAPDPQ
jgi:hypothetical protein